MVGDAFRTGTLFFSVFLFCHCVTGEPKFIGFVVRVPSYGFVNALRLAQFNDISHNLRCIRLGPSTEEERERTNNITLCLDTENKNEKKQKTENERREEKSRAMKRTSAACPRRNVLVLFYLFHLISVQIDLLKC